MSEYYSVPISKDVSSASTILNSLNSINNKHVVERNKVLEQGEDDGQRHRPTVALKATEIAFYGTAGEPVIER